MVFAIGVGHAFDLSLHLIISIDFERVTPCNSGRSECQQDRRSGRGPRHPAEPPQPKRQGRPERGRGETGKAAVGPLTANLMGSGDGEPTTKIVLAPSEASCNGGSIPREPAGPPYPRPHCLRLHIRPLGVCSRFADRGLSVLVIRYPPRWICFFWAKKNPPVRAGWSQEAKP
jgi:hypothetical protein